MGKEPPFRQGSKPHKRPVGAGLSLDKFAAAGVSKYDKRKKIERLKKEKIIKYSKYNKLKRKLEAQGVLPRVEVKDSVAELEALDAKPGSEDDEDELDERTASHALSGPGPSSAHGAAVAAAIAAASAGRGNPRPAAHADTRQGSGQAGIQAMSLKRRVEQREAPGQGREGQRDGKKQRRVEGLQGADGDHKATAQHVLRRDKAMKGEQKVAGAGAEEEDGGSDGGGRGREERGGRGGRGGGRGRHDGGRGGGRGLSRMQRLAQQVAEEKAEKQRLKEEAQKEREARQQRVAAVEKARKQQKHLYFQRTARGQPLMRHRIDKLLGQLQREQEPQ